MVVMVVATGAGQELANTGGGGGGGGGMLELLILVMVVQAVAEQLSSHTLAHNNLQAEL
jgi:uncharacterized membrane protein